MNFSDKYVTLDYIDSWYEDQLSAIREYRVALINSVIDSNSNVSAKFVGFTIDDINDYFDASENELDYLVCLNLLSATEAFIRMDYLTKVSERHKSTIARKYRDLYKQKQERVSLEDDLLEILKEEIATCKNAFSSFIGALNFRNWLAHGRYWVPKLGRNYNRDSVLYISQEVVKAVSGT